ncbi:MAG TPA: 6-carboxytetrahydropterin synthase QueD [Bryobacteraceae bacterium]|jgi:6-pyruvoyltetrahydropterin/6-carboxytetrahydropterin synthase|nr:6-carboxytetrahydropterin synthase QueD [Bryobacteraceae bacterium]
MFEVTVEQTFAAAHALRNYKGSCENVHGHNFKVQVVLAGERLDDAGLLVDFIDVKNLMGSVMARLDHQNLNEVAPFDEKNPSAENIAEYFYSQMTGGLVNTPVPVRILEVKVWETEIQSATFRP